MLIKKEHLYDAEGLPDPSFKPGDFTRALYKFTNAVGIKKDSFFSQAAQALAKARFKVGFKLKTFTRTNFIKNNTGISQLYESEMITDILKSNGKFKNYKHFKELERLYDYVMNFPDEDIISTLGQKSLDNVIIVKSEIEYAWNALLLNRSVHTANIMYNEAMVKSVDHDAYVAWNPYLGMVIDLSFTMTSLCKVLLITTGVEKASRISGTNAYISTILSSRDTFSWVKRLGTYNYMIKKGLYTKYCKTTINNIDRQSHADYYHAESYDGDLYEAEGVVALLAIPIVFYMVSCLLLSMIQFSVYMVYHMRGRYAIMLSDIIEDIEDDERLTSAQKKKKTDRLYKTLVRVDIEEHKETVKKSQKSLKQNIEGAKKGSPKPVSERREEPSVEEDDDDMDII